MALVTWEWLHSVIQDFTPGAAGIWTLVFGMLGLFAKWHIDNRKLSGDEREARRLGYTTEVAALRTENRELAADMRKLREEYDHYRDECQRENDEMRRDLIKFQIELATLKAALKAPPGGVTLDQASVIQKFDEEDGR